MNGAQRSSKHLPRDSPNVPCTRTRRKRFVSVKRTLNKRWATWLLTPTHGRGGDFIVHPALFPQGGATPSESALAQRESFYARLRQQSTDSDMSSPPPYGEDSPGCRCLRTPEWAPFVMARVSPWSDRVYRVGQMLHKKPGFAACLLRSVIHRMKNGLSGPSKMHRLQTSINCTDSVNPLSLCPSKVWSWA